MLFTREFKLKDLCIEHVMLFTWWLNWWLLLHVWVWKIGIAMLWILFITQNKLPCNVVSNCIQYLHKKINTQILKTQLIVILKWIHKIEKSNYISLIQFTILGPSISQGTSDALKVRDGGNARTEARFWRIKLSDCCNLFELVDYNLTLSH